MSDYGLLYLCVDFALLIIGLVVVQYFLSRIAAIEARITAHEARCQQSPKQEMFLSKPAKNRTFWDEPLKPHGST